MTQVAGLAGNRGRNLLHLDSQNPGGAEIAVIVTNREDAPIVKSAAARGIPTEVVPQQSMSRADHEQAIIDVLESYEFELICLDGYMRVLTATFLEATPPILNVHPSLLPAFPGLNSHQQALDAGVRLSGCTVHVVTEAVDGGPIITQESVPVYSDDTTDSLKNRVLTEAEYVAYPRAVRWVATGACTIGPDTSDPQVTIDTDAEEQFPTRRIRTEDRTDTLRYGENPHQEAAAYVDLATDTPSIISAKQLNPNAKELSYNNYNDADGALELITEFDRPAAAVIKHTNPAGCATASSLSDAYADALSTDAMSAFGGIVALNRRCDAATAEQIIESFKEVVIAPRYSDQAIDILTQKENLRILAIGPLDQLHTSSSSATTVHEKHLRGGRLVQQRDDWFPSISDLDIVTDTSPTESQLETMCFAWRVLKHVKSNGIVLATDTQTVGIGMGQVSRVDAVRLATMKADEHAEEKGPVGSVMASDAFFPFPDGVETALDAGVAAVVQPGGSVNDDDVISACDAQDVPMAFTGHRCFRHD